MANCFLTTNFLVVIYSSPRNISINDLSKIFPILNLPWASIQHKNISPFQLIKQESNAKGHILDAFFNSMPSPEYLLNSLLSGSHSLFRSSFFLCAGPDHN